MIQPTEEVPGQFGHPMWKRNAFAGIIVCIIGVLMMITVALFVYGMFVFAAGAAWAIGACLFGAFQERADAHRHTHA